MTTQTTLLHPDRLFSSDPAQRTIARDLFHEVRDLPIVSPHGHCDPSWFARDGRFPNPAELLIVPDHYIFRMLYSQGVSLDELGIARADGTKADADPRSVWRLFASHWHLFQATPTQMWVDYVLQEIFGFTEKLTVGNADAYFDRIEAELATPEFRPRALFERFNIDVLATTDTATDTLEHHQAMRVSGWSGRVIPTFRPDAVCDPRANGFAANIERLGAITGEDTGSYMGYLKALRARRAAFKALGATATDHGTQTPQTLDLSGADAAALYDKALAGTIDDAGAQAFSAHMLTQMACMSCDDGMVMQLHAGSMRDHNRALAECYGPNVGADIPVAVDFVTGLKPLLDRVGNDPNFRMILFTLDEATYARELAPLAGHYPCLTLGPPWWFHDSPEGMLRYRRQVTETAGFYNTAGFNDDTRAFLSIPARHDMARRMDCRYLAELVAEHRLSMADARELAIALAGDLAKRAYRL